MFKILHVITKNIDGSTHRHFFRIEKRIRGAFVAYVKLMKDSKEVFAFRGEFKSLSNEEFKKFSEDGYFGSFSFDTPKVIELPDNYEITIRYGTLNSSKSVLQVESSGKYEDVMEALKNAMDGFNEEISKKQADEGR